MLRTVAIIPARSGSKGIIDKNLKLLYGKTLLEWSIEACKKSNFIDQIIVSTDSKKYADLAIKCGADVPFLRPAEISKDNSTDYEFIKHAIDWFISQKQQVDFIVHIRPTTPTRDPKKIDKAIKLFQESKIFSSLRSVQQMSESAFKCFQIDNDNFLKPIVDSNKDLDFYNNSRQSFPITYEANGYVDVLSVRFINNSLKLHGNKILPFITENIIELDTEFDFLNLENQLKKNKLYFNKIFREDQNI